MYLEDWVLYEKIKNKKFMIQDFAKKVGITPPYLSQVINWKCRPKYEILLEIEKVTEGAVGAVETLNQFVIKQKDKYIHRKKGPKSKEKKND